MEPADLRSRLSGVVAFMVTPFNDDLSLNVSGLRRNLEKLLEQPICAVVAAGASLEHQCSLARGGAIAMRRWD